MTEITIATINHGSTKICDISVPTRPTSQQRTMHKVEAQKRLGNVKGDLRKPGKLQNGLRAEGTLMICVYIGNDKLPMLFFGTIFY